MGPVRLGPCAVRTVSEGHWEGRSDRAEAAWLAKRVPFGPTPVGFQSRKSCLSDARAMRFAQAVSADPLRFIRLRRGLL